MIGVLCGLAIYNFTIIYLPFPLALYKKLLGDEVGSIEDLDDMSPTVAKGLRDLLDYPEDDIEDVFCLNFAVTEDVFGETQTKELKPNGENINVTKENREEYVKLYCDYVLNKSIDRYDYILRIFLSNSHFFFICDFSHQQFLKVFTIL